MVWIKINTKEPFFLNEEYAKSMNISRSKFFLLILYMFVTHVSAEELVGGRLVLELLLSPLHSNLATENDDLTQHSRNVKNSSGDECVVLHWDKKSFNKPYLPIRKPGRYCLDQDYEFTCYPWSHGCGGEFIDIRADDERGGFLCTICGVCKCNHRTVEHYRDIGIVVYGFLRSRKHDSGVCKSREEERIGIG